MALVEPVPLVATDPGYLLWAPLGSTAPTNTVVGSVFTDAWPAAWLMLGATDTGSTFSYQINTDAVEVAEFLDPIKYVTTGRTGSIGFALASIGATNLKYALNGGTVTTTGTTTTTMTTLTPPAAGSEVRAMIGWEALDHTERLICYQTISSGQIQIQRQKGANKATIACEFNFEVPSTGIPFLYATAGVGRA